MMRAFTIVAAIVLALAVPAIADHDHGTKAAKKDGDPAKKMDCCAGEHAGNDAAAKLQEMDAKLQQLVDRMNALQGAAKVDAMAAVLTELTAQRTVMRTMMASQAGMHDCCGGGSCDMMHGKESAAHH
jgi:hypothetical protein